MKINIQGQIYVIEKQLVEKIPNALYNEQPQNSVEHRVLRDERNNTETIWRVQRWEATPPEEVLASLAEQRFSDQDKTRLAHTQIIVAAPVDDADQPVKVQEWPKLCVFYPTEIPSPIALLIHAEFLVTSDRTKILPPQNYLFNKWLIEQIAQHVIDTVNGCFHSEHPVQHLRMLKPYSRMEEHPICEYVWQNIYAIARRALLLPNTEGKPILRAEKTISLATKTNFQLARNVLAPTEIAPNLIHPDADTDKDVQQVLKKLGCRSLSDGEVAEQLVNWATVQKVLDREWVYNCWLWSADFLANTEPNKKNETENLIRSLPIIPLQGKLQSRSNLGDAIVTWEPSPDSLPLPDWLPLNYISAWLQERLDLNNMQQQNGQEVDQLKELQKVLQIHPPKKNLCFLALKKAIQQYWMAPKGDPDRFLNFLIQLLTAKEDPKEDPKEDLRKYDLSKCPIRIRKECPLAYEWAPADTAYFGNAWGENLLVILYAAVPDVPWALPFPYHVDREWLRNLYEALGVVNYPRVVKETNLTDEMYHREQERVKKQLKRYYYNHIFVECPRSLLKLDRLDLEQLQRGQAAALIELLVKNWDTYYTKHLRWKVEWIPDRGRYYREEEVNAFWFDDLRQHLMPPLDNESPQDAPLGKCWLPTGSAYEKVRGLLPFIDLTVFQESIQPEVARWLHHTLELRRELQEIKPEEWRQILSETVPTKIPVVNGCRPDGVHQVTEWYEACLSSLVGNTERLTEVPLLCYRESECGGEEWQYISEGIRWLPDDPLVAQAFSKDCWSISLHPNYWMQASFIFGVERFSTLVTFTPVPENEIPSIGDRFQEILREAMPYIFAKCCHNLSQPEDRNEWRETLRGLQVKVVENLRMRLDIQEQYRNLGLQTPREVEVNFAVDKNEGKLYVVAPEEKIFSGLAKALVEFFGLAKTEAPYYENLLRCNNNEERKEKLREIGLEEEEIERWLEEWRGQEGETEEHPYIAPNPEQPVQGIKAPNSPAETPPLGRSDERSGESYIHSKPPSLEDPKNDNDNREQANTTGDNQRLNTELIPQNAPNKFELKDIEKTEIKLNTEISQSSRTPSERTPEEMSFIGRAGSEWGSRDTLSEQERTKIERCGRQAVLRKLTELGYNITEMELNNPGFDILAQKDNQTYYIEVKAHLQKSKVIELTKSELEKYIDASRKGDIWLLCNVENLAATESEAVTITCYGHIPLDQCELQNIRVPLTKCELYDLERAEQ